MKKKNVATVMAAAMTLGTVAPAFASGVQTRDLSPKENVDVRLASGLEEYKDENGKVVFTRAEIFNYNGADAKDRDKHTLKSKFADKEILVEQLKTDAKDAGADLFVLATKSTKTAEVNAAKAKLDTLKSEIEAYKAKGYKVDVDSTTTKATITAEAYKSGEVTVTLTKDKETRTVVFNNIDEIVKSELTDAQKTVQLRKDIFGEETLTKPEFDLKVTDENKLTEDEKTTYATVNALKYTIEKNIEKFDVAVDEAGEENQNLVVTLYTKGAKKIEDNTVKVITFKNVKDVVKSSIIDMPTTGDFTGHWAQDNIVEAMLEGQVDASSTFRPQASITRAEFAKIACTVLGVKMEDSQTEPFHDVTKDSVFYKYIAALASTTAENEQTKEKESVILGDGENFRPNDTITRQEVAVIVAKLTSGKVQDVKENIGVGAEVLVDRDAKTKFKDDAEIATWADDSVQYLNTTKDIDGKVIVQGDGGKFYPTQAITRAEALVMVQRAGTVEK